MLKIVTLINRLLEKNRYSAGLLALWCVTIFILSSVPGNKYPQIHFPAIDKLMHINLYFWGGLFASLHFTRRTPSLALPVIFAIAYGCTDEIHQLWVPLRTFSLADLMADGIGGFLGACAFRAYLQHVHYPRISLSPNTKPINPQRLETI